MVHSMEFAHTYQNTTELYSVVFDWYFKGIIRKILRALYGQVSVPIYGTVGGLS